MKKMTAWIIMLTIMVSMVVPVMGSGVEPSPIYVDGVLISGVKAFDFGYDIIVGPGEIFQVFGEEPSEKQYVAQSLIKEAEERGFYICVYGDAIMIVSDKSQCKQFHVYVNGEETKVSMDRFGSEIFMCGPCLEVLCKLLGKEEIHNTTSLPQIMEALNDCDYAIHNGSLYIWKKPYGITVTVDGRPVQFNGSKPFIHNGRTQVPVRNTVELMGCDVSWDGETSTVTMIKGEMVVSLQIGVKTIWVDGKASDIDVAPFITNEGRTVLPIRYVAEAFGANVEWNQNEIGGTVCIWTV